MVCYLHLKKVFFLKKEEVQVRNNVGGSLFNLAKEIFVYFWHEISKICYLIPGCF